MIHKVTPSFSNEHSPALRAQLRRGCLHAAAALFCMVGSLSAQLKIDLASVTFDPSFAEFGYFDLEELADAMVEKTDLTILSSKTEKIVLLAGVLDAQSGEILYARKSAPIKIQKTPAKIKKTNFKRKQLVGLGRGPLAGSWDAFEDPLFGFEDPLFGFEDPLFGFEDPLFGFEDPLFGFEDPLFGFEDPLFGFEDPLFGFEDPLFGFQDPEEALNAVWGTNGVAFEPTTTPFRSWSSGRGTTDRPEQILEAVWGTDGASYDAGIKLLILTTVSVDPDSEMRHSAAILPFATQSAN